MNTKLKIVIGLTILLAMFFFLYVFIAREQSGTSQNNSPISATGDIIGEQGTTSRQWTNPDTLINNELLRAYTELFATSWLERSADNIFETRRLRAQGTSGFKQYYDSVETSLYTETGTTSMFQPDISSFYIAKTGNVDVVAAIIGTKIVDFGTEVERVSVRIEITYVSTGRDYLVESVSVTEL